MQLAELQLRHSDCMCLSAVHFCSTTAIYGGPREIFWGTVDATAADRFRCEGFLWFDEWVFCRRKSRS